MSLTDFDDILFICCDFTSEGIRFKTATSEEDTFTGDDLNTLKTNWWEMAMGEILNDYRIREGKEREGVLH
jgi:hypothetical protein